MLSHVVRYQKTFKMARYDAEAKVVGEWKMITFGYHALVGDLRQACYDAFGVSKGNERIVKMSARLG